MAEQAGHFVVAPKLAARDKIPSGWERLLAEIPGVEVLGSGGGMMQIRATPQALKTMTERMGHLLNIEQAAPRTTDL